MNLHHNAGISVNILASSRREYNTPQEWLNDIEKKEDDLFWGIIQKACPAEYKNCYEFHNSVKQDLEEKKELLKKKPETPAEWSWEVPEEVHDEVYKELERKGIDPGNVSLQAGNLKNAMAETTYSTHPNYHAIITFDKKLFVFPDGSKNKYDPDRIHPSPEYMCYILEQVLTMYKEAMNKENGASTDYPKPQQ